MKPLLLQGSSAFSPFRLSTILDGLQRLLPAAEIGQMDASFVYCLELRGADLDQAAFAKTASLLGTSRMFSAGQGFLVTPRKGTVSPWSSKATDIFHNCGLAEVLRVERGIYYEIRNVRSSVIPIATLQPALSLLHDRMTEGVYTDISDLFAHPEAGQLKVFDIQREGIHAIHKANQELGLALSDDEIAYLFEAYSSAGHNPTDVELVMFGQVNSEHCRHKIFNAEWVIDGQPRDTTLFGMIRETHKAHPAGTLVAYEDNSAVVEGFDDEWFEVSRDGSRLYRHQPDQIDLIMKVETHNHPTAICPFPGAATGVGGEIRDECATGIGGKSRAGLSAFMVSNLRVPGFIMPWERDATSFPARLATPLQIMLEGPIGGAGYGNEFGRPQLCGLFRTYEDIHNGRHRGYHKPIMVAGGMGVVKRRHIRKHAIPPSGLIVQLGGPAMRIGLGGGAASSMATGSNRIELDFDSVQRGNAEMERRCQEVIDGCIALGDANPILSIHDIGAGGLSNGCPELIAETGGHFWLRKVPSEDRSLSPMEIWCCEAQERYVLCIRPESLAIFEALCRRERCPHAVIGEATGNRRLSLEDAHSATRPIDIDIGVILGKPPRMKRDVTHLPPRHTSLTLPEMRIREAVERVLQLPAVASKTFLITIADRSITGLVARDQMVGPYQTPIADCAVVLTSFAGFTGQAMAMGERTSLALISAPASGRMAIGEAITNLVGVNIGSMGNIKLSANWMCACGEPGEDANLFDTVHTVARDLCPKLGISIPVGKDSLSMRTVWQAPDGTPEKMVSPLSLIVSSFAPVRDARLTVTPDIKPGESALILVDLGDSRHRLGGSALAQVFNQVGDQAPDIDDPALFGRFFKAMQELVQKGLLLACHDRSDGGLLVTLAEMAIGGRRGLNIVLHGLGRDPLPILFSEELGVVLQVARENLQDVDVVLNEHGLDTISHRIGAPSEDSRLTITVGTRRVFSETVTWLNRQWSALTHRMQALRDNPVCARQEFDNLLDERDPGMTFRLPYDPEPAFSITTRRPPVAILREQGVNGQVEMAAAFDRAGFAAIDVHMTDLLSGQVKLKDFAGLVACGGFSYGDVLGAGAGWAKSILFNEGIREQFHRFFQRPDTFALGVCNGCQMVSQLKGIIPGAEHWPAFTRNRSEQFEARYVTVAIEPSPSIFLTGMEGAIIPVPTAHGEGFADFSITGSQDEVTKRGLVCVRYVDNYGNPIERYPFNPNGSPHGITGLTTTDGRVTILMPHPERLFRAIQMSYRPQGFLTGEAGPWFRMFINARRFAG